jgi:hypothetical protein
MANSLSEGTTPFTGRIRTGGTSTLLGGIGAGATGKSRRDGSSRRLTAISGDRSNQPPQGPGRLPSFSVKKSLEAVDNIPPLGNELKNAYKTSTRARSSGGSSMGFLRTNREPRKSHFLSHQFSHDSTSIKPHRLAGSGSRRFYVSTAQAAKGFAAFLGHK